MLPIIRKLSLWLLPFLLIFSVSTHAFSATFSGKSSFKLSKDEVSTLDGIRDGDRIYSGDVIYEARQLEEFGFSGNLWPNGKVIYDFSPGISPDRQSQFSEACSAWTQSTPLTCARRTTEANYILVKTHTGEACGKQTNVSCSFIGMLGNGPQDLFVYETHWSTGNRSVIQHEIGHAIGMVHEQSRPDRDTYVFVKYQNVQQGASRQFDIDKSAILSSEYDLESIMHYSNCTFSRHMPRCSISTPDLQTIEPKACSLEKVGGNSITALDIEGVRRIYMGAVHALFEQHRDRTCGSHKLNASQAKKMCGDACRQAGPLSYSKVEERSGDDCGSFFTAPDYKAICESIKKEEVKHWTDVDDNSCRMGTANKYEWWVECGCSKQTVPAMCANYSTAINQAKLDIILEKGTTREQAAAIYLKQILKWKETNAIDQGVAGSFSKVIIRDFLANDFEERIYDLLCTMRIIIEARRITSSTYTLSLPLFKRLVSDSQLRVLN